MRARRVIRRVRVLVAGVTTVALVVSGWVVPVPKAAAGGFVDRERSVPSRDVGSVRPFGGAEDVKANQGRVRAAVPQWPAAGEAVVEVPERGLVRAGDLPVSVGRAPAQAVDGSKIAAVEQPARVRVELVDRVQTARRFGSGHLGLIVSRVGEDADKPGAVRVVVDYSAFRYAFGAEDFADRLGLRALPGCVLKPVQGRVCDLAGTPLKVANDVEGGTLLADVEAASTGSVVVLASGAAGNAGSLRATNLGATGSWGHEGNAAGFEYSYPFEVPDGPGTGGPELGLGYSSSSVDGMTPTFNSQASTWAGLGWWFSGAGFVERQFSCRYKEDQEWPPPEPTPGEPGNHRCWEAPGLTGAETDDQNNQEFIISLEGQSSRIVKDGSGWRTVEDVGWRVEHKTGSAAGGEYWLITDGDGTRYRFGYVAASALTIPFVGNEVGEPCHGRFGTAPKKTGTCTTVYRWMLDEEVDAAGNQTVWAWKKDAATYQYRYDGNCFPESCPKTDYFSYDSHAYPLNVTYGANVNVAGSAPTGRVVFGNVDRCYDRIGNPDLPVRDPDQPCPDGVKSDVPWDLGPLSPTASLLTEPAFFTRTRLDTVTTQTAKPGGGWSDVDSWRLRYKLVYPQGHYSGKSMFWLDSIQRTGKAEGGGNPITLPPTSFASVLLANRVDHNENKPWCPKVEGCAEGGWVYYYRQDAPRIGSISNGIGGRIDVTYGRNNVCDQDIAGDATNWKRPSTYDWSRHERDCYPEFWTWGPAGTADWHKPRFSVWNKWLATKVVEKDLVAGSPDQTTRYEYLGKPAWAKPLSYIAEKIITKSGSVSAEAKVWGQWRGYEGVRTIEGSAADPEGYLASTVRYYRGMYDDEYADGTKKKTVLSDSVGDWTVSDRRRLAGKPFVELVQHVTGPDSGRSYTDVEYSRSGFSVTQLAEGVGEDDPVRVREASAQTWEKLADGTWRKQSRSTTWDDHGYPVVRLDYGVVGVAGDTTCTHTSYARNPDKWIMSLVAEKETRQGSDCATAGTVTGRTQRLYDGATDPAGQKPVAGNPTEQRTWTDAGTVAVTKTGYDGYGRQTSVTDPLNKTTTTSYSPAVGLAASSTVTNPLRHTTTTWTHPGHGQVVKTQDPNGKITEIDYDAAGRPVALWQPGDRAAGAPVAKAAYQIVWDGKLGQPTAPLRTTEYARESGSGTAAKYLPTHTFGDGLGRDRETQTASPAGGRIITMTRYDARGNEHVVSAPAHADGEPGSGLVNPAVDTLPQWSKQVHDGLGRITDEIDYAMGSELRRTTTVYRGVDETETVPPVGGKSVQFTDIDDQVTKVQEWDGDSHHDAVYDYDLDGNLTKITDANGNVRTFGYDWAGRETVTKDPDAGTSKTGYDKAGQVTWTLDAKNQKISYRYDELGRRTEQWAGEPDSGTKLAAWSYDTLAKGLPAGASRWAGGHAYGTEVTGYDDQGRPTGHRVTIPAAEGKLAGTYDFTARYDAAGRTDQIGLPAAGGLPAEKVTSSFDPLGYEIGLAGTGYDGTTLLKQATYSKTGRLATRTFGEAGRVTRTLGWNEQTGTLAQIATTTRKDPGTDPVTVQDDTFTYDKADRLTRVRDQVAGQSECFSYDGLSRLTTAFTTGATDCTAGADRSGPDPYEQSFSYDAVGNLTKVSTDGKDATYAYPSPGADAVRPNAVQTVTRPDGQDAFDYDANGAMTTRTVAGKTTTMVWDELGQLARSTIDNKTSQYVYDADGERLIRRADGVTTLYLGGMELELSADGQVAGRRYYTTASGASIAVRTGGKVTPAWLLTDGRQSSQLAIDDQTLDVARQRYQPFGQMRGQQQDAETFDFTDRGFAGKPTDQTTGLIQMGARYYDPLLGRFVSPDPLLDLSRAQHANPYSYAANDPINMWDPDGLLACYHDAWGERVCAGDGTDIQKRVNKHRKRVTRVYTHKYCKSGSPKKYKRFCSNGQFNFKKYREYYRKKWLAEKRRKEREREEERKADKDLRQTYEDRCKVRECGVQAMNPAAETGLYAAIIVGLYRGGWRLLPAIGKHTSKRMVIRGCKGSSFVPGTLVVMADGTRKPIEQIQPGDKVISTNPDTGQTITTTVQATITSKGDERLVNITVDTDGPIGDETSIVTATENHPLWTYDSSPMAPDQRPSWTAIPGQWAPAADLRPGKWLRTSTGTWTQVTRIQLRHATSQRVHNLTISGIHTYHVSTGTTDTLVHNQEPYPPWYTPKRWAELKAEEIRNHHRGDKGYESGRHNEGLKQSAAELRRYLKSHGKGLLPEIRKRLERTAKRWEMRAKGTGHRGGRGGC